MNRNASTPRFERETRGPGRHKLQAPKVKAWNHQDELKALIGRKLRVARSNYVEFEAELVNADQFTLQLRVSDEFGHQSTLTVFKSALAGYMAI
jgi:hypothetical protein